MTEFVTIKPAVGADKKPMRIPMPAGLGLPGNASLLPATGARVPATHFVQRLLADGDAVLVKPDTAAAATDGATAPAAQEAASVADATDVRDGENH